MRKIITKIEYILGIIQGVGFGSSSLRKELNSFKRFISDRGVFVDVGGNKGLYTDEILNIYNPKEIHVFEPSRTNVEILRSKFKNNETVFVNDFGLSNSDSYSTLYSNESGSSLGSLSKRRLDHFGIDFSVEEKIKLTRFDRYWENSIESDVIDLFKIDVEGHELEVLEGIGEKIRKIKIIQFEFGGGNIDTRTYFQDYWYFFKKYNFDLYRIAPWGNYKIKAYRESDERFLTTNYFCVNKSFFG